jgi:hypothetical protein
MERLSIRGYARHRGVSHTAVRKALASGRITADDDGAIDPVIADEEWAASTNLAKPRNTVIGMPRAATRPLDPPPPAQDPAYANPPAISPVVRATGRLASSYADARAARESYLARLAKLDFEERSGRLVNADDVRAQVFALGRRMRDAMVALPDRLAPVLIGQTDQAVIHRILTNEILSCLSELSLAPALRVLERAEGQR